MFTCKPRYNILTGYDENEFQRFKDMASRKDLYFHAGNLDALSGNDFAREVVSKFYQKCHGMFY